MSQFRYSCYAAEMPRTDENGRSLESLLTYMLDGVSAQDISAALGVSHATYHRRKHADDYPDAEELRLIAEHFGLNPVDLMLSFGLVSRDEVSSAGPAMPPLRGDGSEDGEDEP